VHESILRAFPPPICIALTIAILLHVHCAHYDTPPPIPLLYAIHHTILVMAISCKGRVWTARLLTPVWYLASYPPVSCLLPYGTLCFTRYAFTPKHLCTSQSSFYCPVYLHCSHYCNTLARRMRNIRFPTPHPPLCKPYTIQYWQWKSHVKANLPSGTVPLAGAGRWPLHDIAINNIVWCTAYEREGGREVIYCPIIVESYSTRVNNAGGRGE